MATKKTTKNTLEQEYKKELRRIQQFMKRASKRGYFWEESPTPKQPKKITSKSVARLKSITPDTLYKKGHYVVEETGEIITGNRGRVLERKKAATKAQKTRKAGKPKTKKDSKPKQKKGAKSKQKTETPTQNNQETEPSKEYFPTFTDIVLSNFHAQLQQFPNAEGTPLLLSWFDTLIADNGREAVAQMLQEGAEQGIIITWETVYKSVNTKTYMTEMMTHLPDNDKFYSDMIMDMMEQFEWWEQPE